MTDTDIVVEAFTDLAPHYEQVMDRELRELWGLSYQEFIQRLVDAVPIEGSRLVLDVATGTAHVPLAMAARMSPAMSVLGLDITPAMLRAGSANLKGTGLEHKVRLVCASATASPFRDGAFDVVTCALGTHHMPVPKVLAELGRELRVGGQLLLADVHAPLIWRSAGATFLIRAATRVYSLVFRSVRAQAEALAVPNLRTAVEWKHMLSASGFCTIETIATLPPRRAWYPGAIFLRATKGPLDTSS